MSNGKLQSGGKTRFLCLVLLGALALPLATSAGGSLSAGDARKLIAHLPGFALKTKSVHLKRLSPSEGSTIEASAELDMVFRLEKNDQAQWRVAELRTGQDGWQEIAPLFEPVSGELTTTNCDAPDPAVPRKSAGDPSSRRSRCLLASLLGVQLPSDTVRIKSVSSALPLGSHQSALVEALIESEFRFARDRGSWRVSGVRTGTRAWVDPETILGAVNKSKAARALTELQTIAKALEDFHGKRGFYVESNSEATLVDFLSPVYLPHVIRLDPWRRPYRYEGTRDRFSLSSIGPDGQPGTADDIVISGPSRSATAVRN